MGAPELLALAGKAHLILDATGRVVDASQAALDLLDYPRQALAELRLADVLVAELDWIDAILARGLREGAWPDEVTLRRRDGSPLPVALHTAPAELSTGVGVLWVIRPRKRDRRWTTSQVAALFRAHEQLVSGAVHELKTPLSTILGCVEELRDVLAEGTRADAEPWLESIERQGARLVRLIEELGEVSRLHLSRLELSLGRVELAELVSSTVAEARILTRSHRIILESAQPAWVQADRLRIEQVVLNLLSNAIKYSPRGGNIRVRVGVEASESEAVVSVQDHGIGLSPERQARLFAPFSRPHNGDAQDGTGTGLGLYLSHEFVRRHGGRLWCESAEGEGSTFSFSLPLVEEDQDGRVDPFEQQRAGSGG